MIIPDGYLGFAPLDPPAGWLQRGDWWSLRWNGREVAAVTSAPGGARVILNARKLWQVKEVRAASVEQGRRYAERWCAVRMFPEFPLREGVARLTRSLPLEDREKSKIGHQ